jgi:hypothetical protein
VTSPSNVALDVGGFVGKLVGLDVEVMAGWVGVGEFIVGDGEAEVVGDGEGVGVRVVVGAG